MKKRVVALGLATSLCVATVFSFCGCALLDNMSIDYGEWSQKIVEQTLDSVVKITKQERGKEAYDASQGSGVIIHIKDTIAYALTNCHVVEQKNADCKVSYTVTDCYDSEHTLTDVKYQDASYDLALLSFSLYTADSPNEILHPLTVTTVADGNVGEGTPIAHVSTPEGKHNATTFGKVLDYRKVTLTDEAEGEGIQFPVMEHNAYSWSGSSGGLVLNYKMKLVGVEFAAGYTKDNKFAVGYAIPAEKVVEFLQAAQEATGEYLGV